MKCLASLLLFLVPLVSTAQQPSQKDTERMMRNIRHELVMLPYYGVFDNLGYRLDGYVVTLAGQVTTPSLKSDAENVVKRIEGVEKVVNQIEVLPLSPNDDGLRRAVYRAIYSFGSLESYAVRAVPPIHIIARNGNITLVGAVAHQADKDAAGICANGVSGVFSVTNDIVIEQ
jgi:hyperosmotically inducible protein